MSNKKEQSVKKVEESIYGPTTSELYKELEDANLKAFATKTSELRDNEASYQNWMHKNKVCSEIEQGNVNQTSKAIIPKNYYEEFQQAMKLLLVLGQTLALNPVIGILEKNANKTRFTIYSWRFLYSFVICIAQFLASILSFYRLFNNITIMTLGSFSFSLSTCLTTTFFLEIAVKWPWLAREVNKMTLNAYINPKLKNKCGAVSLILMATAAFEHVLSWASRVGQILSCQPHQTDLFKSYIKLTFPWLFELGVPYSLPLGIVLQFINFISTMNWNYADLFIVCMSFYLTSVLEKINEKIICARGKYLPSSFWCSLREDYNQASRLVRSFDSVISRIIFASFASNLFFICLQLFHLLSSGIKANVALTSCPNYPSGLFYGYEHSIYFAYSLIFMIIRSLAVCLIAANVHSASLVPAPILYDVPSPAYCPEVQRFLQQVHGDNVALSGLQFFNITKGLVLSVAGTIVTYELVLLQLND